MAISLTLSLSVKLHYLSQQDPDTPTEIEESNLHGNVPIPSPLSSLYRGWMDSKKYFKNSGDLLNDEFPDALVKEGSSGIPREFG